MDLTISSWAEDRMQNILPKIVSRKEVLDALSALTFDIGATWVEVKRLDRVVSVHNPATESGRAMGDMVVACVSMVTPGFPVLDTVMLRMQRQPHKCDRWVSRAEQRLTRMISQPSSATHCTDRKDRPMPGLIRRG